MHGPSESPANPIAVAMNMRRSLGRLVLLWAALMVTFPAYAIGGDDLLLRASVGLQYESNLFRLPESFVFPGLDSRSDVLMVSSVGLLIERPWSSQVFRASASVVDRRYAEYSQLNGFDHDVLLGWRLLHRDRDALDVSVNQSRQTLGFADARIPGRPFVDTFAVRATAAVELVPRWSALFGAGLVTTDNSPGTRSNLDYQLVYFETGARYDWRTGSVFDFVWRRQSAEFTQQPLSSVVANNGYDEDLIGLRMTWQVSEITLLSGRVGLQHRDYYAPGLQTRTGPGANLTLVWQPRGAWRIDAGLRSELSAAAEINASYARLNGVNATATWFASGKSRLRAGIDLLDRQFQNNLAADLAQVPARKDLIVALTAGLSIQLWRTLELAADWRFEDRNSNQNNFDYRAHTVLVRLGAVF
jgi:hypothetical protein